MGGGGGGGGGGRGGEVDGGDRHCLAGQVSYTIDLQL